MVRTFREIYEQKRWAKACYHWLFKPRVERCVRDAEAAPHSGWLGTRALIKQSGELFLARDWWGGYRMRSIGSPSREMWAKGNISQVLSSRPKQTQSSDWVFLGRNDVCLRQVMLSAVVMALTLVMCASHVFIGKHCITASEMSNITSALADASLGASRRHH